MLKLFNKKKAVKNSDDVYFQICEALKEVMPEEYRDKELYSETQIETLGIDSIKYINLFISLEEIIGKELTEIVDSIDLASIKTVNDIVELVHELRIQ
jgi:acyl carrier protein